MEEENIVQVGRQGGVDIPRAKIIVNGVGILEEHAIIVYNPDTREVYLKCKFSEAAQNTFINGYDLIFYD